MKRNLPDILAFLLAIIGFIVTARVSEDIFERIPHIEDEFAILWQAEVMADGKITMASPREPKAFLVPFVVDLDGQRFGKYPLGWPVMLAVGVFFGVRSLVNSLLAGLAVWLTYRLGKHVFGETVGLLAALLTLTSPFFLMNSGSLLAFDAIGFAFAARRTCRRMAAFVRASSSRIGAIRFREANP